MLLLMPVNMNRLIDFGDSLADFPNKFPLCRYEQFSENEFHCALFEKNYVFVYKIKDQQVIVYSIVQVKHKRYISSYRLHEENP